jgi:hypothetical protein
MNMFSTTIRNIWSDDSDDTVIIDDIELQNEVDEAIRYAVKKDNNSKKSKTLSEEHKRKMREGRQRYLESKRAASAAAETRKRKMQEERQRYLENKKEESSVSEEESPPAKRRKIEFAERSVSPKAALESEPISQIKIISSDTKHIEELNSLQSTISAQQVYITQYSQLLAQRDEAIRSQVDLITRYKNTIVHLHKVTKEQYQAIMYNSLIIGKNKDLLTRQQQLIADLHSMILNLTTNGDVAALESGMVMDIASENSSSSQ